ncbi:MAG: CRISPR-associated endonuclease Cas1 [Gammaproteobacteria bacterium]|nr:CRISPR-associated endonuclease Cas1 [Gammaproteobacteria bacterium]
MKSVPQNQDMPSSENEPAAPPLIPARMINEYQYCPRLAYLEWVQSEWEESADTVDGSYHHRRVDKRASPLPDTQDIEAEAKLHARSVTLSSQRLGLIAKMDLIEAKNGAVIPVDYKRGKRPHVEHGAYAPERVQVCVQGMLLREHGYNCTEGALYFVGSRERVTVIFDDDLLALTNNAVEGLRNLAQNGRVPPPLEDSPKCPRCSLVAICLPDEINHLSHLHTPTRPIAIPREESLPLYVQSYKAKLAKSGDNLIVSIDDQKITSARIRDTSQVVLMGNIYVTSPCLQALMARDIPVTWHSAGGWFYGHTAGNGHKNVEIRTAQYAASFNEATCLQIAQGLVQAKILNCRTLIRRNWKAATSPPTLLSALKADIERASRSQSLGQLLGIEGTAAARYFGNFQAMLRIEPPATQFDFRFEHRNRRPPADPVNALLSFAYALLVRTWTVTLAAVGLDPFKGFYHQPRYGRPALALDMMEPFRPLLADSVVVQVINNGEVRPADFIRVGNAAALSDNGRKRFIAAFERRLSQQITHPLFGYKLSYRRLLELQCRLFTRFLLGELPDYPNFTTR